MTHHDHETRPSQYDPSSPGGLDVRMILIVGAIGAALFLAIAFATEAAFVAMRERTIAASYRTERPLIRATLESQDAKISQVQKIKGHAEHVTVPIDFAIEQFAKQQGENK